MRAIGTVIYPCGAYQLHVFEHIDQIEPSTWDALITPDDIQASHRFIKVCQDANVERAIYRHVIVYKNDCLVAIASFSLLRVQLELLAPRRLRAVCVWTRQWFPSFLSVPVLFCGLPVSFGQSCLRYEESADLEGILSALVDFMGEEGKRLGARLMCFKEFGQQHNEALRTLGTLGYCRVHSLPSCSMAIRWSTFGDYLEQMRAGYRRQIRASLRVRRQTGLDVRVTEDFGAECARIFRLYEQVMDRAEHQLERLNLAFFENLNSHLGSRSRAILLERRGHLLAAAIVLQTETVNTFLLVGIDYGVNRTFHAYLNIVIEVIAESIRSGASRLILGQTSYALKQRMGGETAPLYMYIRCPSAVCHALFKSAARILFPKMSLQPRSVFKFMSSSAPGVCEVVDRVRDGSVSFTPRRMTAGEKHAMDS